MRVGFICVNSDLGEIILANTMHLSNARAKHIIKIKPYAFHSCFCFFTFTYTF